MLCLYNQNGWNSPDDAILHHLPLKGKFDQDLEYKKGVSYLRLIEYQNSDGCYWLGKQLGKQN